MPGTDTKERILEVSLSLFARRGYSAVSIRDICKEVSIKESSVYYHFASKRAIFEALQNRFEAMAEERMRRLDEAVAVPCRPDGPSFENVSHVFFEEYLMDPFCNQFMRLLQIEQSCSEALGQVYERWLFREPLEFQSRVFALLFQRSEEESRYFAVKYYAPVFLFCQRYLLCGELTEAKKEAFRRAAMEHSRRFFGEMGGL